MSEEIRIEEPASGTIDLEEAARRIERGVEALEQEEPAVWLDLSDSRLAVPERWVGRIELPTPEPRPDLSVAVTIRGEDDDGIEHWTWEIRVGQRVYGGSAPDLALAESACEAIARKMTGRLVLLRR